MTLKHFQWVYYMIICHVGAPWGHSGTHGGPNMTQNSTKGPRMAQNHQNGSKCHCMTPNDPKYFQWVYKMIICHVGPPWALFRGPWRPHNGPEQHQKWPFMTANGPETLLMGIIYDTMSCWTTFSEALLRVHIHFLFLIL